MKRRSVRAPARADMQHVMAALAAERQLDLDAEERIGGNYVAARLQSVY
jgi:hypothetical protein